MANIVTVLLKAKDEISGSLKNIRSNITGSLGNVGANKSLTGLQNQVSVLNQQYKSIGSDTSGIVNFGSAFSTQMGAALALVGTLSAAVGTLGNQIGDAIKTQTDVTVTSSGLAGQLGIGFKEARQYVEDYRKSIIKLAADLPGETSDYLPIGNKVVNSLATAGIRGDDLTSKATDITKLLGFVGSTTGMASMMPNAGTKLINGTTDLDQLLRNDAFEKFTGFDTNFKQVLADMGKTTKDWVKMSGALRAEALSKLSKKIVTPDLVDELNNSLDAQLSTLKSSIFDSESGIFGFLRKLPSGRTGLDSVKQAFDSWSNVFKMMASVTGLDKFDPMEGIVSVIDWFTGIGYVITSIMNGGDNILLDISGNLFDGARKWFDSFIANLNTNLDKIDWVKIGFAIGTMLGQLQRAVREIDWWSVIRAVINLVAGLFVAAVSAAAGLFYESIIKPMGDRLRAVGDLIAANIENIRAWIENAFKLISNPSSVGTAIGSSVSSTVAPILSGAAKLGGDLLSNPAGTIGGMLGEKLSTPSPTSNLQSNSNTFAPQISVVANGATDPQGIADRVLAAIDQQYRDYTAGSLIYG